METSTDSTLRGGGVNGIGTVEIAGPAGKLAQTEIPEDLLNKVDSLSKAFCAASDKLHELYIELRPLWRRNFKIVTDSMDALDKTRADAQALLCEKSTEANTERLHTLDKLASMHLRTLERALENLPCVNQEMDSLMEEHAATASRLTEVTPARVPERSRSRSWSRGRKAP